MDYFKSKVHPAFFVRDRRAMEQRDYEEFKVKICQRPSRHDSGSNKSPLRFGLRTTTSWQVFLGHCGVRDTEWE
ncbi:unnamed protein product [Brassica oleracea]